MVDEKKVEETTQKLEELETSEKKTNKEGQDTSKIPEGLSSEQIEELIKERAAKLQEQQWRRMKDAEEGEKVAKKELEKSKKPLAKEGESPDIFGLAKTIATLKDYSTDELEDVALIAKGKGLSLEEAAKTEEAKDLIAARRSKLEKEKSIPEPSSPSSAIGVKTSKDVSEMSKEEHREYEEKVLKKQKGTGI